VAILQGFFRHEYPWWADSFVISMFSITVVMAVLAPIAALLVWRGALHGAPLPASLWTWRHTGFTSWFWEFVWIAVVAAGIYRCLAALRSGPVIAVPTALCLIYLGLVLRAAATPGSPERSNATGSC
jgi:hypothetical protein